MHASILLDSEFRLFSLFLVIIYHVGVTFCVHIPAHLPGHNQRSEVVGPTDRYIFTVLIWGYSLEITAAVDENPFVPHSPHP